MAYHVGPCPIVEHPRKFVRHVWYDASARCYRNCEFYLDAHTEICNKIEPDSPTPKVSGSRVQPGIRQLRNIVLQNAPGRWPCIFKAIEGARPALHLQKL